MNLIRGIESKDNEVNRMGSYYLFANAFGFTPNEVDEMDLVTAQSLSIIHGEKCKEEERAIKRGRR